MRKFFIVFFGIIAISFISIFTFMFIVTITGVHERYNDYLNMKTGKLEKMPSSQYHKSKIPEYKTIGSHWEWNW